MALSMKYENPRFKDIFLIRSREGQLRSVQKETLRTTVEYCVTYFAMSHALSGRAEFMGAIYSLKYDRSETLWIERNIN